MRSLFASAVLALSLTVFTPQANAAPITFEFKGTGSGQIGATPFTDALVVFTGTGDTEQIDKLYFGLFFATPLDSLTVNIQGIGTATLTEPAGVFSVPHTIPDEIDTDDELPNHPLVLLGRLDNPPDLDGFTGIAAVTSDALEGYRLKTSFGPLTAEGGVGFIDHCSEPFHDPCLATSMGLLRFTTNILEGQTGTFTATAHEAPEPATMALMGAGLVAFVRRARRHARR